MADENTATSEGFVMDSKEEEEAKRKESNPLEAEDYIVKVGKIELKEVPTFVNGKPNWDVTDIAFSLICMPYGLKGGGDMKDTEGKIAEPLSKYVFRDINPYSTGFQPDKVTPSFLRAFVAYMENESVQGRIKASAFVLVDKAKVEVTDEKLREQYLEEMKNPDAPKTLAAKGYVAFPDLRVYEGRYISCAIESDAGKGRNKITKFSKLPESFEPLTEEEEAEAMVKFNEFYEKVLAKREKGKASSASAVETDKEVELEEVEL